MLLSESIEELRKDFAIQLGEIRRNLDSAEVLFDEKIKKAETDLIITEIKGLGTTLSARLDSLDKRIAKLETKDE